MVEMRSQSLEEFRVGLSREKGSHGSLSILSKPSSPVRSVHRWGLWAPLIATFQNAR